MKDAMEGWALLKELVAVEPVLFNSMEERACVYCEVSGYEVVQHTTGCPWQRAKDLISRAENGGPE